MIIQIHVKELEELIMEMENKTNETENVCSLLSKFEGFNTEGFFTLNLMMERIPDYPHFRDYLTLKDLF